jgi:hypothetical protein
MAGKKPRKPFKIIMDAPAMLARLHELTGNELKVWMYLWLRTNGELAAFPGNDTMARELGTNIDTVKDAKRGLRNKGWTSGDSRRRRPDGTLSTMVEKTSAGTPQQKEYSVNLELSPSADSESQKQNLEDNQLANQSVVTQFQPSQTIELQSLSPEEQRQNQIHEQNQTARINAREMPSGVWVSEAELLDHMGRCWKAYRTGSTPTVPEQDCSWTSWRSATATPASPTR